MNTETTSVVQPSILETVKEKVNANQLFEKISESRGLIMDIFLYGGIGFLTGYFLKRYSNIVIIGILMGTGLVFLQQFDFINITVHWDTVYTTLGLSPAVKVLSDNFFILATEWCRANMHIVVAWVIGFLTGLKIA
jgi:uncharacterized membrane protein (Fun14 family)